MLSGYYTDYIPMRTNNRGYVYVSSAFKDSLNVSLDNSVTAMIRFKAMIMLTKTVKDCGVRLTLQKGKHLKLHH